jgi:hypothetical protein
MMSSEPEALWRVNEDEMSIQVLGVVTGALKAK